MGRFFIGNYEFDLCFSEKGDLILVPIGDSTLLDVKVLDVSFHCPSGFRAASKNPEKARPVAARPVPCYSEPGPGERQFKKPKIEKVRRKIPQEFLLPRKFKIQSANSGADEKFLEKNEEKTQKIKCTKKSESEKSVKANKFQRRFKKTKRNVRV